MLYRLPGKDGNDEIELKPVSRVSLADAGWNEKDLERYMAANLPALLQEEELMPIFQERPWQPEPDILALDEDGVLYIFELKRWESNENNLLQVMRYGQKVGRYNYDELNDLFEKYRRDQGADNPKRSLQSFHEEYFGLSGDGNGLEPGDFNEKQRFIVVTAGLDMDTVEAINYWNEQGLPVEAKVFRVYEIEDQFLFEFDPYVPPQSAEYYQAETHNYIVNTNYSWDKEAYQQMLKNDYAAAYGDRKIAVDSIQKGDRVFLYHTGQGVIAAGVAEDGSHPKEFEGKPDAMHCVPCSFGIKVDPDAEKDQVVSAREINQELGTGYRFRQTAFSISDEMADTIMRLLKKKQET